MSYLLRPDYAGNKERLGVGIPATVWEIEVPGTQHIAEGRKRAELIGPPHGLAIGHHKPAPRVRHKVDGSVVRELALFSRVESTKHPKAFKQGVVILMRCEG